MIKEIAVKNFRGFQALQISHLANINLFIGKNNLGKTALLEAFFLLLGASNPELSIFLNKYRGVEFTLLDPSEIWGWLFHNGVLEAPVEINCVDDVNINHKLMLRIKSSQTMQIDSKQEAELKIEQQLISTFGSENKYLELEYEKRQDSSSQSSFSTARIVQNNIQIQKSLNLPFPPSIYLPASAPMNDQLNAAQFSKLEAHGEHEEITKVLKAIEPNLKRLFVNSATGIPRIMGDLGGKLYLPITYMGDGINRLLSILLAIANIPSGGIILIDEVENGFHYSVLQKTWEAIGKLSKKRNIQVIATTHSLECVQAAHKAYKSQDTYNFLLARLERSNEKISAIEYTKEELETSFELNWEIR